MSWPVSDVSPAQKLSNLLDEILEISVPDSRNDLILHRYRREIERLIQYSPYQGQIALGRLAAERRDPLGVRQAFKRALQYTNFPPELAFCSSMVALGDLGYAQEALAEMLEAPKFIRETTLYRKTQMLLLWHEGELQKALSLWQAHRSIFVNIGEGWGRDLQRGLQILQERGLTPEEFKRLCRLTQACLRTHKGMAMKSYLNLLQGDSGIWLEYHYLLNDPPEKCEAMQATLDQNWAQESPLVQSTFRVRLLSLDLPPWRCPPGLTDLTLHGRFPDYEKLRASTSKLASAEIEEDPAELLQNLLESLAKIQKAKRIQDASIRTARAKAKTAQAEEQAALLEKKVTFAEEQAALLQKKVTLAEEKMALLEERVSKAKKQASVAAENASVAEEKASVAEEKASVAEEKASVAEEKTPLSEGEAEFEAFLEEFDNLALEAMTAEVLEVAEKMRNSADPQILAVAKRLIDQQRVILKALEKY